MSAWKKARLSAGVSEASQWLTGHLPAARVFAQRASYLLGVGILSTTLLASAGSNPEQPAPAAVSSIVLPAAADAPVALPVAAAVEPTAVDAAAIAAPIAARIEESTAGEQTVRSIPYKVQADDNLVTVARKLGVDATRLAAANNLEQTDKLKTGDVLNVDVDFELIPHVVQAGDTLAGLALRSQSPSQLLAAINNLQLPDRLKPGQKLLVPHKSTVKVAGTESEGKTQPSIKVAGSEAEGPQTAQSQTADSASEAADARDRAAASARSQRDQQARREQFIADAATAAQAAQSSTTVPASVTIAQAILESDWGRAAIGNNYFGIKADSKVGPAGVVWSSTKEFTSKGWITIKAPFRAYENMAQSFVDHAKFFVENSRYAEALRNAHDAKTFAKLIHKAGYATDPQYAQSLIRLMDSFNLYQYDQPATDNTPSDGQPATAGAAVPGPADGVLPGSPLATDAQPAPAASMPDDEQRSNAVPQEASQGSAGAKQARHDTPGVSGHNGR